MQINDFFLNNEFFSGTEYLLKIKTTLHGDVSTESGHFKFRTPEGYFRLFIKLIVINLLIINLLNYFFKWGFFRPFSCDEIIK